MLTAMLVAMALFYIVMDFLAAASLVSAPTAVATQVSCPSTEFTCDDGHCIPAEWICDWIEDCNDRSDEADCDCVGFVCGDGSCIQSNWTCDSIEDCFEGEDEKNCTGIDPCIDGFDVDDCNNTLCQSTEFTCNDHSCISKNNQCDGKADCSDAGDEKNCGDSQCQMFCPDGSCVLIENICDGQPDCSDTIDEQFCDCVAGEIQCETTRVCIWGSSVCDGKNDCGDNSDEPAGCSQPQDKCNEAAFVCDDGSCMWNRLVCDYRFDADSYRCPDRSDVKRETCSSRSDVIPITRSNQSSATTGVMPMTSALKATTQSQSAASFQSTTGFDSTASPHSNTITRMEASTTAQLPDVTSLGTKTTYFIWMLFYCTILYTVA